MDSEWFVSTCIKSHVSPYHPCDIYESIVDTEMYVIMFSYNENKI